MGFEAGIKAAFEKSARKKDDDHPDIETAGGLVLGRGAKHQILGTKRMYHGTTEDRARLIRQQGLDPAKGGTGAGAHVGSQYFSERSRGKIHATGNIPTAFMFSRIGAKKTGEKGRVLRLNVDYDRYRRMEVDPDMAGAFRSKYLGARTTEPITIHEIKGSEARFSDKARRRLRRLPEYIRHNPGRFGLGIGRTLGAGALLALGGHGL